MLHICNEFHWFPNKVHETHGGTLYYMVTSCPSVCLCMALFMAVDPVGINLPYFHG